MEDQKALIDLQVAELADRRSELDGMEETVRKQQERLEREQIHARRDEAKKFAKRLEEKEQILEEVLDRLKGDPSKKLIAKSWNEIKYVKRDALAEAENMPGVLRKNRIAAAGEGEELVPLSELAQLPKLKKGDRLIVCKKGALLGTETTILTVNAKKISVSARGMAVSMKLNELALPTSSKKTPSVEEVNRKQMSNKVAKALLDEEYTDQPRTAILTKGSGPGKSGPVMRMKSNTVDVLGCNFDEARRKCEDKFSGVMMNKNAVIYVLHGHGESGVLKKKLRDWFKRDRLWVKNYKPADRSDGGDAFTVIHLKTMQL